MPIALPTYGAPIPTLVTVDPTVSGQEQANLHTRWHPDIPSICAIELDKAFKVECMDWAGCQIKNDDCADDVLDLDHDRDHHLSGPFEVPGAQPGDALAVDILDIQPHPKSPWGYCFTQPGLGSLDHPAEEPVKVAKSIWDFVGVEASSRHVPHVSFHARSHPGVIGTAPSAELLAEWVKRESGLQARASSHGVELASLPTPHGAYVGQELDPKLRKKIYEEGARTGPARETGGNIDVASLVRGSRIYLPVSVPGAKLSIGDLHFCEADGEPTTAIEMSGVATLRVNLIKNGVDKLGLKQPMYITSPSEAKYPRQVVFQGTSVDHLGTQTDRDGLTAYQNASWNAMAYLQKFGYTREQSYILMSAAPMETKIIATANRPNMTVSVGIPTDIFDFDIMPNPEGLKKLDIGPPAFLSPEREAEFLKSGGGCGHGH
ncbi:Acetamidase/Formamidase [Pseudohyphozyma bogoriensis]|nr:Acetamidase/Formamidase [Pseudohyphozyma bogoriensis]